MNGKAFLALVTFSKRGCVGGLEMGKRLGFGAINGSRFPPHRPFNLPHGCLVMTPWWQSLWIGSYTDEIGAVGGLIFPGWGESYYVYTYSFRPGWCLGLAGTKNRLFTVRSAYHMAKTRELQWQAKSFCSTGKKEMWGNLWRLLILNAAKNFLWRASHEILPTKVSLYKRKVVGDPLCPICRLVSTSCGTTPPLGMFRVEA